MGGGTFGVEAASEYYFGKSVKDINLAEAAMLAGLFKAPSRFAPSVNLPAARARANEVLTNMVQAGFMTEGQIIGARRHPADVIEHANDTNSPDYFLDWAFQQVKDFRDLGDRVLVVRTTVDMGIQQAADDAVAEHAAPVRQVVPREARAPRLSSAPTAPCAPWSAGATTARASSTAPPTRCASRVRRSSRSSMPPR